MTKSLVDRADDAIDVVVEVQTALGNCMSVASDLKKVVAKARKVAERAAEVLAELNDALETLESEIEAQEEASLDKHSDDLNDVITVLQDVSGQEEQ